MNPTTLRLLQAASEATGGSDALAERLGVSHAMLRRYMSGNFPLPDPLLLKALDLILEERESDLPFLPPEAIRRTGDQLGEA